MRVPSGKITTASPRSRMRQRGLHRLLVGFAAPDRERAEAVEEPAEQRLVEQLPLGHEVDRAAAGSGRCMNGSRKLRWLDGEDHAALGGDVLAAEPAQPEVDVDRGLQRRARTSQYTSEFTPRRRVRSW